VAVLGLLLACGATAGSVPETSLRITVWLQGRSAGDPQTWILRCGPSGGSHPRAAYACSRLAALEAPLRPVPKDAICTQQYGGPTEALVTGTFRGRRIWTRFNRRDGCHISRWQKHAFLFPARPASP
jgi:hypothetical protein